MRLEAVLVVITPELTEQAALASAALAELTVVEHQLRLQLTLALVEAAVEVVVVTLAQVAQAQPELLLFDIHQLYLKV
jgi:hypothetical protein